MGPFKIMRKSSTSMAFLLIALTGLTACNSTEILSPRQVLNQGYILDEAALQSVPEGSSREQVLLSLGTPSTTQSDEEGESFYYISQTRERGFAFQRGRLVDQSVLAVYLDNEGFVKSIANYSIENGALIDMISRTTPTSGKERGFLMGLLAGFNDGSTDLGL